MGSGNDNSGLPARAQPRDRERIPGGFVLGSAVAVAARLVPAATGTDTGGSIRQPASLTGITGIVHLWPAARVMAWWWFASSLDQAGPILPSALDCALLLNGMARPGSRFHLTGQASGKTCIRFGGCWGLSKVQQTTNL